MPGLLAPPAASPAALRAWIDRQKAQAEAAREEAETIRLERRRRLSGWSAMGVEVYGVTLVTSEDELALATSEIASGRPSAYVTVRVSESDYDHTARGHSLRQLVLRDGYLLRAPTAGEREAVEKGLDAMGVPRAAYGQTTPRP